MRTFASCVLAAAIAAVALACAPPRHPTEVPPVRPLSEPEPQRALNEPKPQAPMAEPKAEIPPQPPASPQAPIDQPLPQKPFYGPGAGGGEQQAKAEKPLSDGEVLAAATAANKGEMKMAELALKKATNPDVKRFAGHMKSAHHKALEQDKKLEQKAKIEGAESDLSTMLKSDTEKTLKELGDKKGKDFDRAYMDAQLKAHKDVLTALDNRLIPSAQSPEVKSLVTGMRGVVADHLAKAEEVSKKMESAATSGVEHKTKEGKAKAPKEPKPAPPVLKPVPPEK